MRSCDVATVLRDKHFAQRVEHARRQAGQFYEPWPLSEPAKSEYDSGATLWNVLHLGIPSPIILEPALIEELAFLELIDQELLPGRWELTAFRGVLAVRDRTGREGASAVYIGEDSLRFVESILEARPTGRAIDVGCGSGMTSCALARTCSRVTAVDLQEECLEATRLSGILNGVGKQIRTWKGDFFADFNTDVPVNCIVANLPYVPVPPGLAYHVAGNGGPDGLGLNRLLLQHAMRLLDPADSMLMMRFQALGDAAGPMLLPEIDKFAKDTGHDVAVVADGRTWPEVRAALTAIRAHRHNPSMAPDEVLAIVDDHLQQFQQQYYFACGLVSRSGGTGKVTFTNLAGTTSSDLDNELISVPDTSSDAARDAIRLYRRRTRDLADGFWELGGLQDVEAPLHRLPDLMRVLVGASPQGIQGRKLTELIFADRFSVDAARARALYVTTEVMLSCMVEADMARVRRAA